MRPQKSPGHSRSVTVTVVTGRVRRWGSWSVFCLLNQTNSRSDAIWETSGAHVCAQGSACPPRANARPAAAVRGEDAEPAPRWLPLWDDLHDIRVNQFRDNDSRRHRACPITGNGVPDGFLRAGVISSEHRPSGVLEGVARFHPPLPGLSGAGSLGSKIEIIEPFEALQGHFSRRTFSPGGGVATQSICLEDTHTRAHTRTHTGTHHLCTYTHTCTHARARTHLVFSRARSSQRRSGFQRRGLFS